MNYRAVLSATLISLVSLTLYADNGPTGTVPANTTNKTTLSASALISPGRYASSVLPRFNGDMADHLTKSLKSLSGLSKVESRTEDSTIHFTVDEGARVRLSDVQDRVAKVDTDAVVSNPILEPSIAQGL